MSKLCKRPQCARFGTARCSACQIESYCSVECQRANWKEHKITCGKKLLSESELNSFLNNAITEASILNGGDRKGRNVAFLKKILLTADYQFEDRVPGKCYRQFKNGATFMEDWLLFNLRVMLTESCIDQNTVASLDFAFGYATETRAQLEMRRSNPGNRDKFFNLLFEVNTQLGSISKRNMRHEEARCHIEEALTAARDHDLDNSTESSNLVRALQCMANINCLLKNGKAAKFAEEVYTLVTRQYGREHPIFQDTTTYLIDIYLEMGKFTDAARVARMNYEGLIHLNCPIDRKSELFASSKMQVVRVWLRTPAEQRIGGTGAAEEAETLARETCDILENIKGSEICNNLQPSSLFTSLRVLGDVMMERGKKNIDVAKTILGALKLTKECRVGVVPQDESSKHRHDVLRLLAQLYYFSAAEVTPDILDIELLKKAKYAYEETIRIARALYSSDDDRLVHSLKRIGEVDELLAFYGKK
jgi:MYND finger